MDNEKRLPLLASRINKLLDKVDLKTRKALVDHVRSKASWRRVCEQLLNLFQEALAVKDRETLDSGQTED